MSFDTSNGTRGARQPKGPFLKWMNSLVAGRIARKGKAPGMKFDALVLVTRGAKSGEERRSPLGWFPGTDGSWLVVAAAAGAPKNPAWYRNLSVNPHVELQDRSTKLDYRAREVTGDEKAVWWARAVETWPDYAIYQTKTDRQIPVFVLELME